MVAQGELYGNGQEGITKQNLVIKTPQEWNDLLNAMNSVNNMSDNFTETDIDFNSYLVIAVFDEVRGNSGCCINIANIIEYADSIVADVHSYIATSGFDVMNQPYYIAKIPVTNKNIVFNYNASNDTILTDTIQRWVWNHIVILDLYPMDNKFYTIVPYQHHMIMLLSLLLDLGFQMLHIQITANQ